MKILGKLTILCLVFFLVISHTAYADLNVRFNAQLKEESKEAEGLYNSAKQKLEDSEDSYENAKVKWQAAKNRYQQAEISKNKDEVVEMAQLILNRQIDLIIHHLEILKKRLEIIKDLDEDDKIGLISAIDNDIATYQSKKTELENILDEETLNTFVTDLKGNWLDQAVYNKKIVSIILTSRLNRLYKKLLDVGEKFNSKIQELKANNEEVADLEALYNEFLSSAEIAKDKYLEALALFKTMTLDNVKTIFEQGKTMQKEAGDYLKEAHGKLQEILIKLKQEMNFKTTSSTAAVLIEGNGTATFIGSGKIEIQAQGSGIVVVEDNAQDATIKSAGKSDKKELGNNQVRYTGVGDIEVGGTDIAVQVSGSKLTVNTLGTGKVFMVGSGTYKIGEGEKSNVPSEGIEINLSTN